MQYRDWKIQDFSAGLINVVDENILPENAATDCQNFIGKYMGSLKKRPGQEVEVSLGAENIQGLHSYYYGSPLNRRVIAVLGGKVHSYDGTSTTEILSGLDTQRPVFFEDCVNYMVIFNGLNQPKKWDGTNMTDLENAPVDGNYPVLHKEKLFVVPESEPSTLLWSESFQPEEWPPVNYWPVKDGDGDVITNLQKFLGELVVFKRRSIHSLRGTTFNDFRMDELDSITGCVGPRAAAVHKNLVYFVSDDGIQIFNGMKTGNLSREVIPRLWENINKEYLHNAVAGVWDGLIWFALPEGASTENNLVLVFAHREGGGSFWPWRGMDIACLTTFNDGEELILYSGDYSGNIVKQHVGTEDFGDPVVAYWEGKSFDANGAAYEKKSRKVFVEDSPDTNNTVDLQISVDGGDYNSLVYRTNDRLSREYAFSSGVQWRRIKPKVVHDESGACEVRGILMPFRVKRRPRVKEAK